MKIGRNDPCVCGSGKKYKKCCIDKEVAPIVETPTIKTINRFYTYENIVKLSTDEIIERLAAMHIPFNEEKFLEDTKRYYSAEDLSESWFDTYDVVAKGQEEDLPWLAAWILWERLAPATNKSMEQLSGLVEKGYHYLNENEETKACDAWLRFWESLKTRIKPEDKDMDIIQENYGSDFSIHNVCQDLEMLLHNASMEDAAYFEKRINFCREFITYFPDESELTIHNMKRAVAESYGFMGDHEQAEIEFNNLAVEYPTNPWAYIGWGDMYMTENVEKARELYEQALKVATYGDDIETIEDRIAALSV